MVYRNKISDQIISEIRDQILSGSLKPGDKLASEKELMAQFGVSKATMREALRVLEVMGLLEIRKGIGGGAFVAEVDMKNTIYSMINFLHFHPVSIREITMLRYFIEPGVVEIATLHASQEDIRQLRNLVDESPSRYNQRKFSKEITFHRYLARICNNTTLILLVDFIDNLLTNIKSNLPLSEDFHVKVKKAHELILECIIQRDPLAAKLAMISDLIEVGNYLAKLSEVEPFDPCSYESGDKIPVACEWTKGARVLRKEELRFNDSGMWLRRVGNSEIYLVIPLKVIQD